MSDYEKYELVGSDGSKIETLMTVNGLQCSTFEKTYEDIAKIVKNLKNLKFRDNDVLLCTPPKSGTHWGFEIINMLIQGNTNNTRYDKIALMLSRTSQEELDRFESPRVINTHIPWRMLPHEELKRLRTKVVVILRNPKDLVVSYYHHLLGVKHYKFKGKFDDVFQWFCDGKMEYNDWFEYVLEFEKALEDNDINIHLAYYEDFKENGFNEVKKLAKFLEVVADDDLCRQIEAKCSFDNMKVDKAVKGEVHKLFFEEEFQMHRKGQIGDWRNLLSPEQNATLDKLIETKLKDSKLKFRYVPSSEAS